MARVRGDGKAKPGTAPVVGEDAQLAEAVTVRFRVSEE
jgi:hypothetical protein